MAIGDRIADVLDRAGWRELRHIARVERLEGSSGVEILDVRCILKHGPRVLLEAESRCYGRFSEALGDEADRIFPRRMLFTEPSDELAILAIEPIPGKNLEAHIREFGEYARVRGATDPGAIVRRQDIWQMVEQALAHLDILHGVRATPDTGSAELHAFVRELEGALRENLRRAKLDLDLPSISDNPAYWATGYATLAHRDLSVVNIIGDQSGVRFIDPRPVVPNGGTGSMFASPAIDFVALAISIQRKEHELRAITSGLTLGLYTCVRKALAQCVRTGGASARLVALCEAVVYAAYAACRCGYCLAPTRQPLYEHMRTCASQAVEQLHHPTEHGGAP